MEDAKRESGKKEISCYLNIDIQENVPIITGSKI